MLASRWTGHLIDEPITARQQPGEPLRSAYFNATGHSFQPKPATRSTPNLAIHSTTKSATFKDRSVPVKLGQVTYSEARSSLKAVLDQVNEDADVTVISRRDGADAVVMSLDQYQSIMETMHLLSTPANAAALAKGIGQDRKGQARRRELVTV